MSAFFSLGAGPYYALLGPEPTLKSNGVNAAC